MVENIDNTVSHYSEVSTINYKNWLFSTEIFKHIMWMFLMLENIDQISNTCII